MNIGWLAKKAGVTAKTIRYYEQIGLLPAAVRASNGYRDYGEKDLQILWFIVRARGLGFSLDDVKNLVQLWQDRSRASSEVKALANRHLDELDQRIQDLQAIRHTLADLTRRCRGDDRPDCPILDGLAPNDKVTDDDNEHAKGPIKV